MEDGEISEGEILSCDEEDDKSGLSLNRVVASACGQNHYTVAAENTTQGTESSCESQQRKKRNRKKRKRGNSISTVSSSNSALPCDQSSENIECNADDVALKKARYEEENKDGAAPNAESQGEAVAKVTTVSQQNSNLQGKKAKKLKKNSGISSTDTVSLLLQRLSQAPSESKGTFRMKTVHFSVAIRQLLLGTPNGTPSQDANKRVVVVWLSQVSAKMFTGFEESFKQLKSIPGFTFDIENPGSSYFSKLGLEAFMVLPSDEEDDEVEDISVGPLTKADCMLSEEGLTNNGFPSSVSTPPQDWAEYIILSGGENGVAVASADALPQEELCNKQDDTSSDNVAESCDKLGKPLQSASESHDKTEDVASCSTYPMFALDCEMVNTSLGLELARVSVVDESLQCLYDSFVKPQNPVLDYLTRYSGITEETLRDVTTTLADVQQSLVRLLPKKCILVGHSLENDFRALKLSHPHVIDTSCLFTPSAPTLYKPGLRLLTKQLLLEDIQHSSGGHSSVEDAMACMKLVKKKIAEGRACVIPWTNKSKSLISELAARKKRVAVVDKASVVNLFGQDAAEKVCVADDNEAVNEVLQAAGKVDFAFVQLHAVEQCLKTSCQPAAVKAVLSDADERAARIVRECPAGSTVFVVCGSSCINEVKKLQTHCSKGKGEQRKRLREEIAIARHGIVRVYSV